MQGKGSGMIHPNMATMLVFITTDCAISAEMLNRAVKADVKDTFNMISVDGDTSTNDMLSVIANGMAGNDEVTAEGTAYVEFAAALRAVTTKLCRAIAKDGEGASKLLECRVVGAKDVENARTIAKSVICSSLVKAAMFGADANWGRVLCAPSPRLLVSTAKRLRRSTVFPPCLSHCLSIPILKRPTSPTCARVLWQARLAPSP